MAVGSHLPTTTTTTSLTHVANPPQGAGLIEAANAGPAQCDGLKRNVFGPALSKKLGIHRPPGHKQ